MTSQLKWSTAPLPEPERFAFWQEAVGEAFVSVSVARRDERPFIGSVTAARVDSLAVSHIASPPQSVTRSRPQIRTRAGDSFFLNLPLTDGALATQDGRTAHLARGDFAIVDSTRPFELDFERDFEQISLTIPHDLLAPRLASPLHATAVRVRGDVGIGAIASAAIRALPQAAGSLDRAASRSLSEHIAGLVALALGPLHRPAAGATSTGLASPKALLQAALDEVEREHGDVELSPARVAERVGISIRYLHQLFSERGPSFGRWLLLRRLEHCRHELADPACPLTIGEIAWQHGFRDPSYFARAFRAQYGVAPRQFRGVGIAA